MDQETVGMIARNRFAKLLQRPRCRCMRGDVAMHNAPCPDLHPEKHIVRNRAVTTTRKSHAMMHWA